MKKVEELEAKMKALEAELKIEQEKECRGIEKEYQWVIGKCLRLTDNVFFKIISIEKWSDSSILEFKGVRVYHNEEKGDAISIEVRDNEYADLCNIKEYMEEYTISNKQFYAFFNKAVEALRGL